MQEEKSHIDELMGRYFDGRATMAELEELNGWLEEDGEHVRRFLRLQNLHDATNPAFSPESIDVPRALRAVKMRLRRQRRIALWGRTAAAVAVIALMAGAAWLISDRKFGPEAMRPLAEVEHPSLPSVKLTLADGEEIFLSDAKICDIVADSATVAQGDGVHLAYARQEAEEDSVVYHTLEVPRGSEFLLELADGSRVWINAETTVRYPVRFSGDERRIFVEGEAYLEVARDTAAPFTVAMAHNEVTVLGTSFNVNSYPEQSADQVTLVSGRVSVRNESGQVTLQPGEQALIPRGEGRIAKRTVDTRLYCGWKDGVLIFKNNTLDEILRVLARQYDVEIYWHDESLKQYTFTGELKRYESIDTLLRMIGYTDDVRFTVHGRQVIVARP